MTADEQLLTTTTPSVSIVLLTYNGMPAVRSCLEMIASQQFDGPIEVVHIDSGSTDGTLEIAQLCNLKTHHIPNTSFHHSSTRNLGALLSSNEIVVYLSQDAVPTDTGWLRALVSAFADPRVGASYGRQIPPSYIGPVRRCSMACLYPARREVRDPTGHRFLSLAMIRFSNVNCAIRRQLLTRLQFDRRALVCEDHGMCRDILAQGYKIVYEPDASVLHGHERGLFCEFEWAVDNAISLTRMGILGNRTSTASEVKYGWGCVRQQLAHFLDNRQYMYAFRMLCTSAVRFVGAQLGKRETALPAWLLRRVSPGLRRDSLREGI